MGNVMPTATKNGVFQGRETILGVCSCPCGQPTVRFADHPDAEFAEEWCQPQTMRARIDALNPGFLELMAQRLPGALLVLAAAFELEPEEFLALMIMNRAEAGLETGSGPEFGPFNLN